MRVRTPWPDGGSHQCWTSPSTNCRAAARRRCSRVSAGRDSGERHAVLKLVAEAVGAARLIERRSRPHAAGERLIEQPAIEHDVHRPVRRFHLDRAEHVVPMLHDLAKDRVEIGRAVARDQGLRVGRRRRLAEEEDDLHRLVRLELDRGLQGAAGIEAGADPLGEGGASPASAAGLSSVPLRPRNSRRSPVQAVCRPPRSAKATREPNAVFQGLRASIAPVSGSISVTTERRGRAARRAEHPFDIGRDRKPPRPRRRVADRQARDLDRIIERHVLEEIERDAVRGVLEPAVALAVPGDIGRGLVTDRQGRRSPQLAGVLVAQIDDLARPVGDRVVRPGRELVLAAVERPGVAAALDRDLEAERGVGDDIDPRRRRRPPGAEDRHILPSVLGESAEPVEELEVRRRRNGLRHVRGAASASAAAARRRCPPPGRRSSWSDSVPRRPTSTTRATTSSRARVSGEMRSVRSTNTAPRAPSAPICGRDWLVRTSVSSAI